MNRLMCGVVSATAIALTMPFSASADWQWAEDMVIGPTDVIRLAVDSSGYNYSEKTNTSLTVRGKLTFAGASDNAKYRQCFSGSAPKFSVGPEPGDPALIEYAKMILDNDKVQMTIGENGGQGCVRPVGTWANSTINVNSLTLAAAAQTTEPVFDVLSVGHASQFVATTIKNDNVKPMRIKFTSTDEGNQYRCRISARNTGKLFEIPKGDIILSGTSKAPAFIISRWNWGYSLVKPETAASGTGGFLEFASTDGTACEVILDCCSEKIEKQYPGNGHFIFNYNRIRWNNKGNVYLASCQDSGIWAWPGKPMENSLKGGLAKLTVANALPYGPQTGLLVVHGTTLDFNGNDQKVNGLVVRDAPTSSGPSVGQITAGKKVTVTVGEGGVSGTLAGNLVPVTGEIDFVKVDGGTLVLSNATIRTLVVNGGVVRPAAGTSSTVESLTFSNAELVLKVPGDGSITCGTMTKGENAVLIRAEFRAGDKTGISFESADDWTCPAGVAFVNATDPAAEEYRYHICSRTTTTNYKFVERDDVTYYGHIRVDAENTSYWPSVYLSTRRVMTFNDFKIGPCATFHQGNGSKTFSIDGRFTVCGDGNARGINLGVYYKQGVLQFEESVIRGDENAVIQSSRDYVPGYSNGVVFVTAENYRGIVRFDNQPTAADTFFTLGDTGDSSLKGVVLGTNMQFRAYAATDKVRVGDLTFKNETQFLPQGSAEGHFSCVTVTNALTIGSTPVRVKTLGVASYPARKTELQRYPVLKWPTAKAAGAYTAADFDVSGVVARGCSWTVWQEGDMSCFGLVVEEKKGLTVIFR